MTTDQCQRQQTTSPPTRRNTSLSISSTISPTHSSPSSSICTEPDPRILYMDPDSDMTLPESSASALRRSERLANSPLQSNNASLVQAAISPGRKQRVLPITSLRPDSRLHILLKAGLDNIPPDESHGLESESLEAVYRLAIKKLNISERRRAAFISERSELRATTPTNFTALLMLELDISNAEKSCRTCKIEAKAKLEEWNISMAAQCEEEERRGIQWDHKQFLDDRRQKRPPSSPNRVNALARQGQTAARVR